MYKILFFYAGVIALASCAEQREDGLTKDAGFVFKNGKVFLAESNYEKVPIKDQDYLFFQQCSNHAIIKGTGNNANLSCPYYDWSPTENKTLPFAELKGMIRGELVTVSNDHFTNEERIIVKFWRPEIPSTSAIYRYLERLTFLRKSLAEIEAFIVQYGEGAADLVEKARIEKDIQSILSQYPLIDTFPQFKDLEKRSLDLEVQIATEIFIAMRLDAIVFLESGEVKVFYGANEFSKFQEYLLKKIVQ